MIDRFRLPTQKQVNQETDTIRNAGIRRNSDYRPRLQLRITLPLDTASLSTNPYALHEPFDGFYVEDATDSGTNINMSLSSPEGQNITQYTNLKKNDAGSFDAPVDGAWLTWPAQSGKSITLVVYMGVKFRPGSLISVVQGGVSILSGTGMTPLESISVGTTATLLDSADVDRKKLTIQNNGSVSVFISGVDTVVATKTAGNLTGIDIVPGATYEWINSGSVYAITASSTAVVSLNKES